METYIFFIILISLIANVFIAYKMVCVSTMKGYEETAQIFILCFLFTVVGYLYVIALPDLSASEQRDEIIRLLKESQSNAEPLSDQTKDLKEDTTDTTKNDVPVTSNDFLEVFKSMSSVHEMLDYVSRTDNVDEKVVKIIKDMDSIERMYGNMKADCIKKLSEQ